VLPFCNPTFDGIHKYQLPQWLHHCSTGVHMISMNRCFYITSFTFKELWLYELKPYIVCIEQNSVKYIQKVIYFNWMHVVYLSQQYRLTLLNMLTRFIRKFIQVFIFFFYPKICILEIVQMKIFDFSTSFTQKRAFSKFSKWKSLFFPKLEMILGYCLNCNRFTISQCAPKNINIITHLKASSTATTYEI